MGEVTLFQCEKCGALHRTREQLTSFEIRLTSIGICGHKNEDGTPQRAIQFDQGFDLCEKCIRDVVPGFDPRNWKLPAIVSRESLKPLKPSARKSKG